VSSRIRVGRLRDVFRCDQGEIIDAQMARLCVLYEDLRIEMMGIVKAIPQLDILDSAADHPDRPEMVGNYRYFYFMRRSIATISEFADALHQLNESPSFSTVSSTFEEYSKTTWASAIAFFDKKTELLIRSIRNDIGGHFGLAAAVESLKRIRENTIGKMELFSVGDDVDIRLHFAGEIAITALLRHLEDGDISNFKQILNDTVIEGYRHATRCVQVLCGIWVWQRFGR
jgi:hypothetical protein